MLSVLSLAMFPLLEVLQKFLLLEAISALRWEPGSEKRLFLLLVYRIILLIDFVSYQCCLYWCWCCCLW